MKKALADATKTLDGTAEDGRAQKAEEIRRLRDDLSTYPVDDDGALYLPFTVSGRLDDMTKRVLFLTSPSLPDTLVKFRLYLWSILRRSRIFLRFFHAFFMLFSSVSFLCHDLSCFLPSSNYSSAKIVKTLSQVIKAQQRSLETHQIT